MKKTQLIILAITIFLISLFGTYYYFSKPTTAIPISTGGDKPQQVPREFNAEVDAMEKFGKLLPVKTPYFSIEFNFKKGKYIVTKINSANLQSDFDKWYDHSDFKDIPKTRFLID